MRFHYSALISLSPDSGEPTAIFRPEVPIRLHGPHSWQDLLALVDTGADNTILPESVARLLDIPLTPASGPAARAFGGQEVPLLFADVKMELLHDDGLLEWHTRVFFQGGTTDDDTVILGQQGFLDYFTATFVGEDCTLELAPNAHLPRL